MMNDKMTTLLGILGGFIAGVVAVGLGEAALHALQPPPAGVNFEDSASVTAFLKSMPVSHWLMLLGVYVLAAILAGFVTHLICRHVKYKPALITGVGLAVTTIANFMSMGGHPTWMWVASILGILVGAWAGGRLVRS